MANLQYIFSSFLLIIPFIIAGIIEAVYDSLFLKQGKILNLANPAYTPPLTVTTTGTNFRSVFVYDTAANQRELIGSNNPNVFFATDAGVTPTRLSDYNNRLEAKFTGANNGLDFDIFINGVRQASSGSFSNKREYLYGENLLYQYNYGEWLAVVLVGVFGITLLRILNKELTVANIVQASKKFRLGLFGIDTSMETGRGVTVIKALKALTNIIGWIVSFFVFPTSNLMFFISFLAIMLTFTVSFFMTVGNYSDKWDSQWKTAAGVTFPAVILLFIGFRYYSDRSDPEKINITKGKNFGGPAGVDPRGTINGTGQSITTADAFTGIRAINQNNTIS